MKNDWWDLACPQRYIDLELNMRRKKLLELALSRAVYSRLVAARIEHGDFTAYHRRWNHGTASIHCIRGREKSVGHLFQCRKVLAA